MVSPRLYPTVPLEKGSGLLGTARYREFEARSERSASEEFLVGPHTADEDSGRSR